MKTLVAMFDDFNDAERAVDALLDAGISRSDISVVANNANGDFPVEQTVDTRVDAVDAGQGATFGAMVGGLVGLGALLIPGIGPVVAVGPLAAVLAAGVGAAAGAVTGGITAALIQTGIPEKDAGYYAEAVRRGNTLVTVNATNEFLDRAQAIFTKHGAADFYQRTAYYDRTGYTGNQQPDVTPSPAEQVMPQQQPMSGMSGAQSNSTMGMSRDWESYLNDFRELYDRRYASSGYTFEQYEPAYLFGYTLAKDARYNDYDWTKLEPTARAWW